MILSLKQKKIIRYGIDGIINYRDDLLIEKRNNYTFVNCVWYNTYCDAVL